MNILKYTLYVFLGSPKFQYFPQTARSPQRYVNYHTGIIHNQCFRVIIRRQLEVKWLKIYTEKKSSVVSFCTLSICIAVCNKLGKTHSYFPFLGCNEKVYVFLILLLYFSHKARTYFNALFR